MAPHCLRGTSFLIASNCAPGLAVRNPAATRCLASPLQNPPFFQKSCDMRTLSPSGSRRITVQRRLQSTHPSHGDVMIVWNFTSSEAKNDTYRAMLR